MPRQQIKVPFGYEQPKVSRKGTVIVLETFEDWHEKDVEALASWANERKFVRVVLYPQHEETLRRMGISCASPYYARVKQLKQLTELIGEPGVKLEIDEWEGKRKKYTPIDTSLNFLTDKYHGPYFVAMSDRYANLFVTYPSFKEWIKKVRLIILTRFHVPLHEQLDSYADRWEKVELSHDV